MGDRERPLRYDAWVPDYLDRIREFALAIDGAREEFSFGEDSPVYKAANGKIFAISGRDGASTRVSLKLSPDEVLEALTLPFVDHAPYLSKTHWVATRISNEAELEVTFAWMTRSHELVTAKPARKR